MKKHHLLPAIAALGLLSVLVSVPVRQADAQGGTPDAARPTVFQAAGTTVSSILCSVDHFRAALGQPNNANTPGPLTSGRREINWDGGGATDTAPAPTPFPGFLQGRGALFTTPGTGFVRLPSPVLPPRSRTRPTRRSFNHSVPFGSSHRLGATSPTSTFSCPEAAMSRRRQPGLAWSSQTSTSRMGLILRVRRLFSITAPTSNCCSAASSQRHQATQASPSSGSCIPHR